MFSLSLLRMDMEYSSGVAGSGSRDGHYCCTSEYKNDLDFLKKLKLKNDIIVTVVDCEMQGGMDDLGRGVRSGTMPRN